MIRKLGIIVQDRGSEELRMEHRVDPMFKELVGQGECVVGLVPITQDDLVWPDIHLGISLQAHTLGRFKFLVDK
jgi:hypothetical protein